MFGTLYPKADESTAAEGAESAPSPQQLTKEEVGTDTETSAEQLSHITYQAVCTFIEIDSHEKASESRRVVECRQGGERAHGN